MQCWYSYFDITLLLSEAFQVQMTHQVHDLAQHEHTEYDIVEDVIVSIESHPDGLLVQRVEQVVTHSEAKQEIGVTHLPDQLVQRLGRLAVYVNPNAFKHSLPIVNDSHLES